MPKALIVTHAIPDADAVASAMGVKKIVGNADILIPGGLNATARQLLGKQQVLVEWPEKEYSLIICVDFSSEKMCPGILERKEKKIVIDHHTPKREFLKHVDGYLIDKNAGSTTELVYMIMKDHGIKPEKQLRKIMAAGIYYDTVSLRVARKTSLLAMADLLETNEVNIAEMIGSIGIEPEESEKIARLKACQRARLLRENGVIIASATVSAFEGPAASSLMQAGADISFVGSKKNGRIGARARPWLTAKGFSLSEHVFSKVARDKPWISYGGHKGAAGMQGIKQEEFKQVLEECVEKARKWAKGL